MARKINPRHPVEPTEPWETIMDEFLLLGRTAGRNGGWRGMFADSSPKMLAIFRRNCEAILEEFRGCQVVLDELIDAHAEQKATP